jgi:DNA-binding beta-propeller fold protein YncE
MMSVVRRVGGILVGAALAAAPLSAQSTTTAAAVAWPAREYRVLVAAEAVDQVATIVLGPSGARVERTATVGMMLADPDGPHGVAYAPDGATYYVSTAHGTPYGWLWKFRASDDSYLGKVMLGNFPATLQLSPDSKFAYVVNFNLHGEMVPSDVSVVSTDDMTEIARITTCAMPHGSRLSPDGLRHYSACMMSDQLVEIDARGLVVSRHFVLTKGREAGMDGPPMAMEHAGHDMGGHGLEAPKSGDPTCSPTWAQPSADGRTVWVACNKTSDLVEIDVASWTMRRRIPAGDGVYNLAATRDGRRLIASNKRGQSVSIIDIGSGKELARLPTLRKVVHGIAITADDRYAFVSVEGIGSQPGTVEIIDLVALTTIARVDVGQMAGGIDVAPDGPR